MIRRLTGTALALGALAPSWLSGCSQSGYACPQVVPVFPYLAYPQDGAVNVPDGTPVLILSFSPHATVLLSANGGVIAPVLATTPVPSPLPSGMAATSPPFGAKAYAAYALPRLPSASAIEVSADYGSGPCLPGVVKLGAFTTR